MEGGGSKEGGREEGEREQQLLIEQAKEAEAARHELEKQEIAEYVQREERIIREDGLPITFQLAGGIDGQFGLDSDEFVANHLLRLVKDKDLFYIGGTSSPHWRWSGGLSTRGKNDIMTGHGATYSAMTVLSIRKGVWGGHLEKCSYREQCQCIHASASTSVLMHVVYRKQNGIQSMCAGDAICMVWKVHVCCCSGALQSSP